MCLAADCDRGMPYTTAGVSVSARTSETTASVTWASRLPRARSTPTMTAATPAYQSGGMCGSRPAMPGVMCPAMTAAATHADVPSSVAASEAQPPPRAL